MLLRAWTAAAFLSLTVISGVAGAAGEPDPQVATPPPPPAPEWYSLHFQMTAATQAHPSFAAAYSGKNSLSPDAESATAFVASVYADLRLWKGAEVLFTPEMSGGKGLSSTL